MTIIRSKIDEDLIINFPGGKSRILPGKATMNLTPEEFSSKHIENLLKSGKITIAGTEDMPKKKWKPYERAETETSGTGETIPAEESAVSEEIEKEPEEIHEPEPKKTGYVRKKR